MNPGMIVTIVEGVVVAVKTVDELLEIVGPEKFTPEQIDILRKSQKAALKSLKQTVGEYYPKTEKRDKLSE